MRRDDMEREDTVLEFVGMGGHVAYDEKDIT